MAGETENTTTTELPANATVDEAVTLMADLEGDDDAGEASQGDAQAHAGDAEGKGDDGDREGDGGDEGEPAPTDGGVDAPEFWAAEDKAAWAQVPPEIQPLLKKYEQQRVEFVNEKAREAAKARADAQADVKKHTELSDANAKWWTENAPKLAKAFESKWAQVDWDKLSREDPAQWAALRQQAENEGRLLAEADQRGRQDIEGANKRQEAAVQAAKAETHRALATRYPEHFGEKVATKTYDDLGKFLLSKGIPADRINAIHEAPIIEIALEAMLYQQAKKQASAVTTQRDDAGKFTVQRTPTRVVPGASQRGANRNGEAIRQVSERFRKGGGSSIEDAAELIRLSEL